MQRHVQGIIVDVTNGSNFENTSVIDPQCSAISTYQYSNEHVSH
jgi:hypothetical protein